MGEDVPERLRTFRSIANESRVTEEALDLWAEIRDEVSEAQRVRLLMAWSKVLSTGKTTPLIQACDQVIAEIEREADPG